MFVQNLSNSGSISSFATCFLREMKVVFEMTPTAETKPPTEM